MARLFNNIGQEGVDRPSGGGAPQCVKNTGPTEQMPQELQRTLLSPGHAHQTPGSIA